jgi:hypothetical protein
LEIERSYDFFFLTLDVSGTNTIYFLVAKYCRSFWTADFADWVSFSFFRVQTLAAPMNGDPHYPSGIGNGRNMVKELLLNSGSVCFVMTYTILNGSLGKG